MKAKTKQKIAKWFAIVVVFVMIFQVLMPLFTSGVIGANTLNASVTNANQSAPQVTVGQEQSVSPAIQPTETVNITPAAPAGDTKNTQTVETKAAATPKK